MPNKKTDYDVIRREERTEDEHRYLYELLMRRGENVACWRMPLYSIRVNMTDEYGNEGTADAQDVFSDEEKALGFFEKLVRNLATPIDLPYVLEDEMLG
ncbi:MAG: hypothetical protein E7676_06250 [Ruminococcaceae bacterium]|nr:hypothetical protein [Oscillospiraceae bacterium]